MRKPGRFIPDLIAALLANIRGEDSTREGLRETPERFRKAWLHWTSGYGQQPARVLKAFKDGSPERGGEIVLVSNIPVYSMCEHHLAPFWGLAHVGYLPHKKVLGLSKFARLVDVYARRLQVQERLTHQVADALVTHLTAKAVGVVIECRHMCMESRGVRARGTVTSTSALRGEMFENAPLRAEFMSLVCNASTTRNGL